MDYKETIVSFCLWGKDAKYQVGAIRNIEIIQRAKPEWKIAFYIADDVNSTVIGKIQDMADYVQILPANDESDWSTSFWRFRAVIEHPDSIVFIRDTDSRLTEREFTMMEEFIDSDKKFHIIRDHPNHYSKIMAGLWGTKGNFFDLNDKMMTFISHTATNQFYSDQHFLNELVYNEVKNEAIIHDEFRPDGNRTVPKRINWQYCGQPITARDQIERPEDTEILKKWYQTRK